MLLPSIIMWNINVMDKFRKTGKSQMNPLSWFCETVPRYFLIILTQRNKNTLHTCSLLDLVLSKPYVEISDENRQNQEHEGQHEGSNDHYRD